MCFPLFVYFVMCLLWLCGQAMCYVHYPETPPSAVSRLFSRPFGISSVPHHVADCLPELVSPVYYLCSPFYILSCPSVVRCQIVIHCLWESMPESCIFSSTWYRIRFSDFWSSVFCIWSFVSLLSLWTFWFCSTVFFPFWNSVFAFLDFCVFSFEGYKSTSVFCNLVCDWVLTVRKLNRRLASWSESIDCLYLYLYNLKQQRRNTANTF